MSKMQYHKAKLNATFAYIYAETAEEKFDAIEMSRMVDKMYKKGK